MKRPGLAFRFLLLSICVAPLSVEAQPGAKAQRVGFLWDGSSSDPRVQGLLGAFLQGAREFGYVEGQNLIVENRYAEGRPERLAALAAELVQLGPDVLVATGTPSPLALKGATSTIPIIAAASGDLVGSGLVASLARPGGNVTGLSGVSPDIAGKRLQLLKELLPAVSRVAVLSNGGNPYPRLVVRETEVAARVLSVQLQSVEVQGPDDLERAFAAIAEGAAGALVVVEDPLTFVQAKRIVEFVARRRLPTMYGLREFVATGGLLSYGVHLPDLLRRAGGFAAKVLKGAKPADIPVEQPTKFELVINMKTAKLLGLTIPPSVSARADEVVE